MLNNVYMRPYGLTCTGASIGHLWWDGDFPALIHTHPLQTFVHADDEPTLPDQSDFSCSFLMAVKEANVRSGSRAQGCLCGMCVQRFIKVLRRLAWTCRSLSRHFYISK